MQGKQSSDLLKFEYVPAGQFVQADAFPLEKVPGLHGVAIVLPAAHQKPGGQKLQELVLKLDHEPLGHK